MYQTEAAALPDMKRLNVNKQPRKNEADQVAPEDPADAVVAPGTVCRRKACGHQYVSDAESRGIGPQATCRYHPGAPVFHEGSKGWSCCTRKVLEFDEFLKIKGCREGKHMFLDPAAAAAAANGATAAATNGQAQSLQLQQHRRDWFQTRDQVVVSVYVKKLDKTLTKARFDDQAFHVDLVLQGASPADQKPSTLSLETYLPIVPAESTFEVLSTKIEITLKKASGISWPSLEPAEVDAKECASPSPSPGSCHCAQNSPPCGKQLDDVRVDRSQDGHGGRQGDVPGHRLAHLRTAAQEVGSNTFYAKVNEF